MAKLKEMRVKLANGGYSEAYPIGADAVNVDLASGQTVEEAIVELQTNAGNLEATGVPDGGSVSAQLKKLQDTKQDALTFDDAPKEGSENPVRSSGLYSELKVLRDNFAMAHIISDDVVGLEVDFIANTTVRLGAVSGLETQEDATAFLDTFEPFGGRRRCILADDGTVVAYYGEEGFVTDGSVGQVMVEQPAFYYRVEPLKVERIQDGIGYHLKKARYYISKDEHPGFKLHPAFKQNGRTADKIYLSAFRGSLWDLATQSFILDDVTGYKTGSKLCSIAGAKPASGYQHSLTRNQSRLAAANRGEGWTIRSFATVSMTNLLFMIEYASMNAQNKLSVGHTNDTWDNTNKAKPNGSTIDLGNASGEVAVDTFKQMTYRGEENLYGMRDFVDGINIECYNKHIPYVADYGYADNKIVDNYKSMGFTIAKVNGYASAIGYTPDYDYGFLPSMATGNSNGVIGDYLEQNAAINSIKIALCGGYWNRGANAGLDGWDLRYSDDSSDARISARLQYFPVA